MKKVLLSVEGMTCSACSGGLERFLSKQKGIEAVSVNLIMANVALEYDENLLDIKKLKKLISKAGFSSSGIYHDISAEKSRKSSLILFGIYTALFLLLMALPVLNMKLEMKITALNVAIALLALSFAVWGFDIIKNGIKFLFHGMPNMETLVGTGVVCSFLYSTYALILMLIPSFSYEGSLFFSSSAMVIYFVKLGRIIDNRGKTRARDAISRLVKVTPETAIIKDENGEKTVRLDTIKVGDLLVSKTGIKTAADGTVESGCAYFDVSFLTGESEPVKKCVGDTVLAGSVNQGGYVEYRAVKVGKNSAISEIVRLVSEASASKTKISRLADKISGIFVPVVLGIALLTFIAGIINNDGIPNAIQSFVTVLSVACPCSLGLAVPLAVTRGEGLCAENGILVKKSEVFEKLPLADAVIFDKTGTLTYGKMSVSDIVFTEDFSDEEKDKFYSDIYELEKASVHPLAKAICEYISAKITVTERESIANITELAGMGMKAQDGESLLLCGNARLLESNGITFDFDRYKSDTETLVFFACGTKLIAVLSVGDILRDDAEKTVSELRGSGIYTVMLTGDGKNIANRTAQILHIDKVYSEVVPTQKADIIKQIKATHKCVIMCGDGINDSPALSTADVGISLEDATDIAVDSADVILNGKRLYGVYGIIKISRDVYKIIKENLFWAFFYNALMLPLAAGVFKFCGISITPAVASGAMVISSLTVILNSLRIRGDTVAFEKAPQNFNTGV